jgi:5-methylcytosine-specific restriction protein A
VDYDALIEDGSRLAPKQILGVAATLALGFRVGPRHFAGGLDSACFRILANAGYRIVPKGEATAIGPEPEPTDHEWSEGTPRLRQHLRRERAQGLRQAKLAEFRRLHDGQLSCERCRENFELKYHTVDAEVCIDVHHRLPVSEMLQGHRTRLKDLQCLCANCHRIVHHEMRMVEAAGAEK